MDPYLRTLDNFATAAFYELAIRRTPTCSPNTPHWFNPAPLNSGYPWTQIRAPEVKNPSDAEKLACAIKSKGNEFFKKGEYYEALWKYEHALYLCRSHDTLNEEAAALHSNIAAVCLKFGSARRIDLLDATKIPPSIVLWFVFTQQHATEAIKRNPPKHIACKAHWRRGESFKEIVSIPELRNSINTLTSSMSGVCSPCSETYVQVILDFIKCVDLQEDPDAKILAEIIVLAVNHKHTELLSYLSLDHIKSDFSTQLILELLKRPDTVEEHLTFLLLTQEILPDILRLFDGSKVEVSALLRKEISYIKIYEVFFRNGMTVRNADFYVASDMQQKRTLNPAVYRLILSKKDMTPQVEFFKLKEEGNSYFSKGSYEEALGYYFQALHFCRKNKLVNEMATIRANCAQACLKLHMYEDAYTHCTQCLKVDPTSHKGYFRRAEALRAMLDSPKETTTLGCYKDVVKDYLESHAHQANADAFCLAVIVTIDRKCPLANIPKLLPREVRSGFTDKVLQHLFRHNFSEEHLDYILWVWPGKVPCLFNASSVQLGKVLPKIRKVKIYERLLELGMPVTDEDIITVVKQLPDKFSPCLEIILFKIELQSPIPQCSLDNGCKEALRLIKYQMVVVLLEHGAKPNVADLKKSTTLLDNPLVQKHLKSRRGSNVVYYDSNKEVVKAVADLNKEARSLFKRERYSEVVVLYKKALALCEEYELTKEAVTTHCNLSLAYRKQGDYHDAYKAASAGLNLDNKSAKAYFRRAEALKMTLDAKNVENAPNYDDLMTGYNQVIDSCCTGNVIESNPKALCDAVMVAVNYSKEKRLFHSDGVSDSYCTQLLNDLVSRPDCKPKHLQYVLCTMWASRQIDASEVSLKHLLADIGVTELSVIQRLSELRMPVKKRDVSAAIKNLLPDDQVDLFKHIVSKCPRKDLNSLCAEACSVKKFSFAFVLLDRGAIPPKANFDILIQHALGSEDFRAVGKLVKVMPKDVAEKTDLASLLKTSLVRSPELILELIDKGVNPNGFDRKSPITAVLSREYLPAEKKSEVICILLKKEADCNQLCRTKKGSTTPLHVATDMAFDTDGNTALITAVFESPTFDPKKIVNDKGETPLHLAVKPNRKRGTSRNILTSLLAPGIIDPSRKDRFGKRPIDLLSRNDSRTKIFEQAAKRFKMDASQHKKRQRQKANSEHETESVTPVVDLEKENKPPQDLSHDQPLEVPPKKYSKLSLTEKFQRNMDRLFSMPSDYFVVVPEEPVSEPVVHHDNSDGEQIFTGENFDPHAGNSRSEPSTETLPDLSATIDHERVTSSEVAPISSDESGDMATLFSELGFDVDSLPWEVEGTERVVKFFKDVKRNSQKVRMCAARVIFSLAEGKRNYHLAKGVSNEPGLSLYEARITKAARLLWEKAISYSSKLTGLNKTPVYTQVIRIWDVVLNHDALDRKIKRYTEQIEASHKRGQQATLRWSLKPDGNQSSSISGGIRGRETIEVPIRFQVDSQDSVYHFVPAASTNDNEYNITTFVSFDTIVFKSILLGTDERRDFPFKEWQKEHEIIKLCSKEAILLLGRSGTGKTTCCLYRLWNEFKAFWNPLSPSFDFKLPRKVLISPVTDQETENENDSVGGDLAGEVFQSSEDEYLTDSTEDNIVELDGQISPKVSDDVVSLESAVDDSWSQDVSTMRSKVRETVHSLTKEGIYEDLHQVFVTKNYVLCDQIKKRFYNMAAAHDFIDKHMEFEHTDLPNSFTDIENFAYPIFITARQFYILLDNSLGNEKAFFKRDAQGNLSVRISSLDYDHEDVEILLDLEESDSEDEGQSGVAVGDPNFEPHIQRQHTERWSEVTALYFKEMIWPTISNQCQVTSKDFDPMLVWIEIQSFIKGSEKALKKGAPLGLGEYQVLGNKMAPNFSNHRKTIFQLFEKYQLYKQRCRHSEFLFDECDLILHLYKRLRSVKDVPWSFHSIYLDEVQDFTQAELSVFIHCCRNPNSMFFTGDTAQSIMRGIAFRFQDLRSLFHQIHESSELVGVPQKPFSLTINFRSHSGILKLAGSIIDLIREFFKDSIDLLPDDEGMFSGPTPVLVESCQVDDLALLLSANKRKTSTIEFGAHQAIIVQSKESKEKLPDILKGAIVLTIFEAKGLEFDDVLLYNFFTDSLVDEKGWRVITSYLEMSSHADKVVTSDLFPGASNEPRSRCFDPKIHKSLNAELKYLYTAITRTKCNLWIYDSDKKVRLPMFDYWHKRKLVKVVRTDVSSDLQGMYNLVFASNSTTEQWKAQGNNFKKKHLWEQARLCYERAGDENLYLAKEANAYHLIQNARQQKPSLYFEAAVVFLECDYLHHRPQYINAAALCVRNTRPPRHTAAAKLYERLGELGKACQSYLRAKDFDNFIRIKEAKGEYSSVIRTLLGKPYMRKRDALIKAHEYGEQGIEMSSELSSSELSYSCAKFYSERRDKETLVDVLQYMPEMERRVRFLKEAKLFEKAFAHYEKNSQYEDAYRLASAQGWFEKGQALARTKKNVDQQALFILQIAKSKYKQFLTHVAANTRSEGRGQEGRSLNRVDSSERSVDKDQLVKAVGQAVIDDLSSLMGRGRKQKNVMSTYAVLLLGMITVDKNLCTLAWRTFKHLKHKVGEMEAFNQVQKLMNESIQTVLDECHLTKEIVRTFQKAKDINNVVQQGLRFYDLHKLGMVYCTPPDQDVWITDMASECQSERERYDIDGMLVLDVAKVKESMSKHCDKYISEWVSHFQLERSIPARCESFSLHKQLLSKKCLEREYSPEEVSSAALESYIQSCVQYLELRNLFNRDTNSIISLLVSLFTPQVFTYLPQRLNDKHVSVIRRSTNIHVEFSSWIDHYTFQPSKELPERVSMDTWLTSWRACCLYSPYMKPLLKSLSELESQVNKRASDNPQSFDPPAGFIFWKNDSKYYHLFSIWFFSCSAIRETSQVVWASMLAIYHFLGSIASSKTVSISVPNIVDILSVHCTALLVCLCHVVARQNRTSSLTVPMFYKNHLELFDLLNSQNPGCLRICVQEVSSKPDKALQKYYSRARLLLVRSLDFLLGTYRRASWFCVLRFTLDKFPNSDGTRHCLILALTLFGNLIMLPHSNSDEVRTYHQKFKHILTRVLDKSTTLPSYVAEIASATNSPNFATPREVFRLVNSLLHGRRTLAKLVFSPVGKNGKVEFCLLNQQPPRNPQSGHQQHTRQLPPRFANQQIPPRMLKQQQQQQSPVVTPLEMQPSVSAALPYQQSQPTPNPSMPLRPHDPTHPFPQPFQGLSSPMLMATVPFGLAPVTPIGSERHIQNVPQTYLPRVQSTDFSNPQLPGLPLRTSWTPYPAENMTADTFTDRQDSLSAFNVTPKNSELASEGDNPVTANVVASYSIDELRKLASTVTTSPDPTRPSTVEPGTGGFDFEFPYDPDFTESRGAKVSEDQYYKDLEEEEGGLGQALVGENVSSDTPPNINPELLDPSIITHTYCSACRVNLVCDEETNSEEEMEDSADLASSESYFSHVSGNTHYENLLLCKRFMSMVDSEDVELSYPKMVQKLEDLMISCKKLKASTETEKLDKIMDSIRVKMDKNNRAVTQLQEKLSWREGIEKLTTFIEDMDRDLYKGKKLFEEVRERQVMHVDEAVYDPEQVTVGELESLSDNFDNREQDIFETKERMRSAGDKQVSRLRKKERRSRGRAKGGRQLGD